MDIDIDLIFASVPIKSNSNSNSNSNSKIKKNKNKKRKHHPHPDSAKKPRTAPVPETVIDTSSAILSKKPPKKPKPSSTTDQARFKDSRRTGPRRKTEEGFSIFKEDELGINVDAGDTPLCPFDCQCCF